MPEWRRSSEATGLVAGALGKQLQWRRIRVVALAMSTAALLLSIVALGVVAASYDGRQLRADARTPQMVDSPAHERANLLWAHSFDAVGVRYLSVIYLHPLVHDAPLPPGLREWPGEGEVILSPAALDEGRDDGIETRFGTVVGTIGQEGLVDARERLAYVVPMTATISPDSMQVAAGFGKANSGSLIGVMGYMQPMSWLMLIFGLFMIVPALIFITIAARIGHRERSHRGQILAAMGATRLDQVIMAFHEAWRPVLVGIAGAIATVVAVCFVDLPLPGVAFTLMAGDRRSWSPALLAMAVGTAGLAFVITLGASASYRTSKWSVRPVPTATRIQPVWAAVSFVSIIAVPFFVRILLTDPNANESLVPVVYLGGLIVIALTIRHLIAALFAGIATLVRRVAWIRGLGGTLIGAAKLRYDIQGTIPIAAALAVAIILISQFQVQTSMRSSEEVYAEQQYSLLGDEFAFVAGGNASATLSLPATLPTEYAWLRVTTLFEEGETFKMITEITSTPVNLERFGISELPEEVTRGSLDYRLAAALDLTVDGTVRVIAQPRSLEPHLDDEQDYSYLIARVDGAEISIPALKETVASSYAPMPNIRSIGESARTGVWVATNQYRWMSWSTVIAMLILAVALGFGAFTRAKAAARELAGPAAIIAPRSAMIAALAWTTFVPLAASSVAATLISIYYGAPMLDGQLDTVLPATFIGAALTISTTLALGLWLASAHWLQRAASTWTTASIDDEN